MLVAWLHLRFSPIGYHPSDDGYILAQSWRILDGQIPHRDIISPRPLGSALLHTIDFALPLPLFEASRLIFVVQTTTVALLFACLVYRLPPARWTCVEVLGAGLSVLVSLHTFPFMAWHTVDGLTFLAVGSSLLSTALRRGSASLRWMGLFALGSSVLMKQSFLPGPLLGLLACAWSRRHGASRQRAAALLVDFVFAILPGVAYATAVTFTGGLDAMIMQLGQASQLRHWGLFDTIRSPHSRGLVVPPLLGGVVLVVLIGVAKRSGRRDDEHRTCGGETLPAFLAIVLKATFTLLVMKIVLDERLALVATWGTTLFWLLVAFLLVRLAFERSFDTVGWLVAAAAFMASISWGYSVPNLMAGPMALVILQRVWVDRPPTASPHRVRWRLPAITGAVALAAAVVLVFINARSTTVYRDRRESALSQSLRAVSGEFGRVRTNPNTARYLGEVRGCLGRYPARAVAVLPDNAGLYPALRLRNPFPIDWLLPVELEGSEDRILQAAAAVARTGDYLVLLQRFPIDDLAVRRPGQKMRAEDTLPYSPMLMASLLGRLDGRPITCGPFVGEYER